MTKREPWRGFGLEKTRESPQLQQTTGKNAARMQSGEGSRNPPSKTCAGHWANPLVAESRFRGSSIYEHAFRSRDHFHPSHACLKNLYSTSLSKRRRKRQNRRRSSSMMLLWPNMNASSLRQVAQSTIALTQNHVLTGHSYT